MISDQNCTARSSITTIIVLHEKFLQFDWLRAVVFQLNLKYLQVKITNLLRVVVQTNNSMICTWYFKIISKFTRLTAREITYNNFQISLVVYWSCYLITYIQIQISHNFSGRGKLRILVSNSILLIVAGLFKSGPGNALHVILYNKQKWCDLEHTGKNSVIREWSHYWKPIKV